MRTACEFIKASGGTGANLARSQSVGQSSVTKQQSSLAFSITLVWSIMYHCRNETSSFKWFVRSFPPTSILRLGSVNRLSRQ